MGALCNQLDLFAAQGVPSYGDACAARAIPHDQPPSHAQRWHLHAAETAIAEAEAAADPRDHDDDENERGEVIEEQVPARTLQTLADEYWPLVDQYDRAMRATGAPPPHLEAAMKALEVEANGGQTAIYGGRDRYPGPYRLRALVKWRARREGRLPMWGIKHHFRFLCRGMHVVAELGHYGLSLSLDQDRHRPGDPCWSDTGYRSFSSGPSGPAGAGSPVEVASAMLEAYIDQPRKGYEGGLGGQLKRWVPFAAKPWWERERDRKGEGFNKPYDPEYRRQCPGMTPEAERAAYWAEWERRTDEEAEAALAWMEARGVDPYQLFPDCKPPAQASLL